MAEIFENLPGVFIHPRALVETTDIGEGTRVWAFSHVMKGARVGAGCNLCDGAFVEGGAILGNRVTVKNAVLIWDRVTIEDEVFLGPNMIFTNDMTPRVGFKKTSEEFVPTLVRKGASIGANATIVCGVTIGRYAFVGAGAVVVRTVPDHALVVGNPARQKGWVCACMERLPEPDGEGQTACPKCQSAYRRTDTGLEAL